MFGFVWKPISGGALSPTLFLAPLRACQFSPGLRPGPALGLVYSVAFVFSSSCHQGGLPRLPFLPSWTCSHPGQPGKAASYLISHLVDICLFFLPIIILICHPLLTGKTKTTHNLKAESSVLLSDPPEDYSPGFSLSERSEELFQRSKGGPGYTGVLAEEKKM